MSNGEERDRFFPYPGYLASRDPDAPLPDWEGQEKENRKKVRTRALAAIARGVAPMDRSEAYRLIDRMVGSFKDRDWARDGKALSFYSLLAEDEGIEEDFLGLVAVAQVPDYLVPEAPADLMERIEGGVEKGLAERVGERVGRKVLSVLEGLKQDEEALAALLFGGGPRLATLPVRAKGVRRTTAGEGERQGRPVVVRLREAEGVPELWVVALPAGEDKWRIQLELREAANEIPYGREWSPEVMLGDRAIEVEFRARQVWEAKERLLGEEVAALDIIVETAD